MEVVSYYSQISEIYDKIRLSSRKSSLISHLQIQWFIREAFVKKPNLVLEIGVGTGRIIKHINSLDGELVASDASVAMLRQLRCKMINKNLEPYLHVVACDASNLPFHDERFEVVFASRVFWHLSNPRKATREALRVTRTSGNLLYDFPNKLGFFYLLHHVTQKPFDVLTLFTTSSSMGNMFSSDGKVSVRGNVSPLLYLLPSKALSRRIFGRFLLLLLLTVEKFGSNPLLKHFYTYYLVKIEKM